MGTKSEECIPYLVQMPQTYVVSFTSLMQRRRRWALPRIFMTSSFKGEMTIVSQDFQRIWKIWDPILVADFLLVSLSPILRQIYAGCEDD